MLPAPTCRNRLLTRFRREEDGTISIFVVILFTLMIMMGGFAVDLMRTEYVRNSLQQSLDRCTLAAAALNQTLNPDQVCRDYVSKAGHAEDLTSVNVSQGLNFREVSADGMAVEKPFFAQMMGIDEFDIPATSIAEQRITDIEIAMVLDVSGSMIQTPSRIAGLRVAAKEFIQTVLETDAEGRTSIAIVPFNGQVMLGPLLAPKYNVTLPNGTANMTCVDLPPAAYATPGLSRTLALPMTANADTFSGQNAPGNSQSLPNAGTGWIAYNNAGSAMPVADNRWCPPQPGNQIRLPGNNIATLQGYIDGLVPVGATSINAGMRWGLALLDPSARPMFAEFRAANQIPASFAGRPFDYMADGAARPEMMKVILLMTDGEHFAEERVNDAFKSTAVTADTGALGPLGRIWRANSDGNYSRFIASRAGGSTSTPFWVPHLGIYQCRPWNGANPPANCYTPTIGTTTTGITLQTWPQILQAQRASWVAWQLFARTESNGAAQNAIYHEIIGNTNNDGVPGLRALTPTPSMDAQLQDICTMAKDRNVIVYGIAFEAPVNGQNQIRLCARTVTNGNISDNNYFPAANSADLRTAFRAIAARISQLRLTQ